MTRDFIVFFFFKQKTAYELRISDWSSDVCSSDLRAGYSQHLLQVVEEIAAVGQSSQFVVLGLEVALGAALLDLLVAQGEILGHAHHLQIGRASCRERVCQYV